MLLQPLPLLPLVCCKKGNFLFQIAISPVPREGREREREREGGREGERLLQRPSPTPETKRERERERERENSRRKGERGRGGELILFLDGNGVAFSST